MVCAKCGTDNPPVARYCETCGEMLKRESSMRVDKGKEMTVKKTLKSLKNEIIAVSVVSFIVICILIALSKFGENPCSPIDLKMKALNTGKVEHYIKMFPAGMQKCLRDNPDEALSYESVLKDSAETAKADWGNGTFDYEIIEKKAVTKEGLAEAEKAYKNLMEAGFNAETDEKFTKGYMYEVRFIYKCTNGEIKILDEAQIYVYKVKGKWCSLE